MSVSTGRYDDDLEDEEEPELEAWVRIQNDTFTNWVNDKLRPAKVSCPNIRKDFKDGTKLCLLMLQLLRRKLKDGERIIYPKKKDTELNHYEASGNLALAIKLMEQDGVRLVNIGAEDIRSGNLKLILGMIWTLIRKYQIGATHKTPPKKLMLAWVNAILHPHLVVSNFSSDWNDGQALHGMIEWCAPGTFPQWMRMSTSDPEENCRVAMEKADQLFNIPQVISPENMASPNLDELSGMTFVSYFMHEGQDGIREAGAGERSCGYDATLSWANQYLLKVSPDGALKTTNFDIDWIDGYRACALITALGGNVPGFPDDMNRDDTVRCCDLAMTAAEERADIPRVIPAKDMADKTVDHLGVMAYVAWHRKAEDKPLVPVVAAPPPPPVPLGAPNVDVNIPANWRIDATLTAVANSENVGSGSMTASIQTPNGLIEEAHIRKTDDFKYDIPFTPREKGIYRVSIFYEGREVQGSPFNVNVYDISYAKIIRQYGAQLIVRQPYAFQVNVENVGFTDLDIYIFYEGRNQQYNMTPSQTGIYDVTFTPEQAGKYMVSAYCGGEEIPGSPFELETQNRGSIIARGEGLRQCFTGRPAKYEVDTSEMPGQTMETKIHSPTGHMVRADVTRDASQPNVYMVEYFPEEEGTHQIEIFYSDGPISGSPFYVNIREPQVYVKNLDFNARVNNPSHFQIDATEMLDGTVEIDSALPVLKYEKTGNKMYQVTILPRSKGKYDLAISINGKSVKGSPFDVEVVDE